MAKAGAPHWQIERLASSHERDTFSCGKPALDAFVQKLARQYERRGFAVTYIASNPPSTRVFGYYSLSVSALTSEWLPEEIRKKLPRHPLPSVLLGRLAVDQQARGQGLGEFLLLDALTRCLQASQTLGIHAVEVRAIDEEARHFYLKYGFMSLGDDPLHLYLPIKTIDKLLRGV